MEMIHNLIHSVSHLDQTLTESMKLHGMGWTYMVLFVIIFSETGFVVTPFLPGDSLLFAAGALAATPGSPLSVGWLFLLLIAAAIGGKTMQNSKSLLFGA